HGQEGCRDEQRLRAAVGEDVGVLLGRQQRVEADGHHAGLDGAPERDGEVGGVEQQQRHARLAGNVVGGKQRGHAVRARLQLAIGQRLARIDEGGLGAAAVQHVAIDHVDGCVVDARIAHGSSPADRLDAAVAFATRGPVAPARLHHTASSPALKGGSLPLRPATMYYVASYRAENCDLMATTPESGTEARRGAAPAEEAYLKRVGERVRLARARRGMSRKSLARASGVSERYLAELERGAGNASLLVLRQIAHALSIEAAALVSDAPERPI